MQLCRITLTCFVLTLSAYISLAQPNSDISPRTFALSATLFTSPVPLVLSLDKASLALLDTKADKQGHMPRFARSIQADIGLTNAGIWTTLSNGDRIWRARISAPGALALIPCYDGFFIPQGATLHIYSPQKDEVIGAFTADNNPTSGIYNTGLIHGEECIVEYYEPAAVAGKGRIHINEVGYAYRMVPGQKSHKEFGDGESCEVNVACSEGDFWQDQKNSVVRILVKTGSDYGWCSGTLLNNANQDCTPYILSADHCYQDETNNYTAASAADLNQWIFYFNYQSPTCANPATEGTLGRHFITGCSFRAASLDNGGERGSDFVLIKANSNVPLSYSPYFAGWSHASTPAHAGVSIHHPSADIKKISTYANTLTSSQWGFVAPGTHWKVSWLPTANGDGVTEPGSSGSAIFDFAKRVVGTLTGGNSSCSSPASQDYYGKLSYHWGSNGVTSNMRLSDWLDPAGTGIQALDGVYAPCAPTLSLDAGIQSVQQTGSICANNLAITATLTNYGVQQLSEDSLTYIIDGGSPQVLDWLGTLNTLESAQVSLPVQNFPAGTHTLHITSASPNGGTDGNAANDSKTTTFTVYPASHVYTYTLHTGDMGSQISWELLDANNSLVYAGGPYANTAGGQIITQSWCLPPGCYSFHIFNSTGNGLNGVSVNGSYTITDYAGNVSADNQQLSFGSEETTTICSSATAGIDDSDPALADISIYPNPSSGIYTVTNSADATLLTVSDALGRLVLTADMMGEIIKLVDMSASDSGVYFFRFSSTHGTATRKVILNRGK